MPRKLALPHPGLAVLRTLVLVLGLWYLGLGIAGFTSEGTGMGFDSTRDVWVFGTSGLLNIGHTGWGALGVAAAHTEMTMRAFGWLTFFGFAGLFAYSLLAVVVDPLGNLANVQAPNVWLYGVTSLLGLYVSLVPLRKPARGDAT